MQASRFVTFYADGNGKVNFLFEFKVNNSDDAFACVKRFKLQGYSIRVAWYHEGTEQHVIERRPPSKRVQV